MEGNVLAVLEGTGRSGASRVCIAAIGIAALAAGCGDSEDTANAPPKLSAANEKPESFVKRVAKLLETTTAKKDCAQLKATLERSLVSFSCPPGKDLNQSMATFEVVDAEEYGAGAVVDYRSGAVEKGAAILLFATPSRTWAISQFGVATKPSVGTSDANSRPSYDVAVESYLRAIRTRDCAAFKKVTVVNLDPRRICSLAFKRTTDTAKLLKRNPQAKPKYEGGNAAYGFYSFETTKPVANRTITVAGGRAIGAPRSMVMSVTLSPTSADQRKVLEQLKKQQRNEPKPETPETPETSPTKKAGI